MSTVVSGGRVHRNLKRGEFPGLVAPYSPALINLAAALTAGNILGCRVVVPDDGVLHDLASYHGVTSGNHRLGVYDTGDTLPGSRTLLWDSGSLAVGAANAWQVAGDPALTVKAGQNLDFVITCDNATATFGRVSPATSAQQQLPVNFVPVIGGASPKLFWAATATYAALPPTITEANCSVAAGVSATFVMARVAAT